jgi:hypothetical protein
VEFQTLKEACRSVRASDEFKKLVSTRIKAERIRIKKPVDAIVKKVHKKR